MRLFSILLSPYTWFSLYVETKKLEAFKAGYAEGFSTAKMANSYVRGNNVA